MPEPSYEFSGSDMDGWSPAELARLASALESLTPLTVFVDDERMRPVVVRLLRQTAGAVLDEAYQRAG